MELVITIRNWERFQHYHDRMPPWIKLHKSILEKIEWVTLPDPPARLLIELWLLASEDNGTHTTDSETLAWRLRRKEEKILPHLEVLVEKGFIELGPEDASNVLAIRKRDAIQRRGEERERREEESTCDFEDFWKAYPKRKGANPKKPAKAKWLAAVKRIPPDDLLVCVKSFARRCSANSEVGTPFVPMTQTWLNQARWEDERDSDGNSVDEGPGALHRPLLLKRSAASG